FRSIACNFQPSEAEIFMRLILSAMVVLLLAACASQPPVANNAADSQATSNYLRKSATAKETVDVDKQSVGDLTSAD
ncbi:hypothetical protein, partial [Pseudomonas sp. HY2-MNA-CIBAN-0224]|uniref:hypothetical protein n=1 Tax=Pseudomonas sp. HY2-MNA-CIBAN-0224 TaxID=3140471 RepID=UPI003320ACCF